MTLANQNQVQILNADQSFLKIACFYARSVVNKLNNLNAFLVNSCYDIDLLFITESWLHLNITDSLIDCQGFNVLRDDRCYSKGGGVLLLYKCSLKVIQHVPCFSDNKRFEYLCIDVFGIKSCVRLSCFYIPPSTTDSLSSFTEACNCLVECHTTKHPCSRTVRKL